MKKRIFEILAWIAIISLLGFGYKTVTPEYSFANDSLIKLLQAKSLLAHHFRSDNYYYFLQKYDTSYQFFPIDYHLYHIQAGSKHVGPFGVLFSVITAPLLGLFHFSYLPYVSGILFLISLVILRTVWKLSIWGVLLTAFCTSLLIYSVEYSENILFLFLSFITWTLFFKARHHLWALVLSGLCFGISVGLRLESVLFFPFFALSYLFVVRKFSTRLYPIIFFSLSFGFVLLIFFAVNFFLYGHILGTKFLADQGNFYLGIEHKINNYISLLFGKKEEAFFKVGFFGLTPLFLWIVIWIPLNWKQIPEDNRVLFCASLLYILVAPGFAPHDGQWSWGARYLAICIIPFAINADHFLQTIVHANSPKWKKILILVLSLYSIAQLILGIKIIGVSAEIMKLVQKNTIKIETDLRLYHSGIFALHTGPQILDKPSLLAADDTKLQKLIPILKRRYKEKKIAYIYSQKLDLMLQSGGVPVKANSSEYIKILSEHFTPLEEKVDVGTDMEVYIFKI
jgi:hypothetical protein